MARLRDKVRKIGVVKAYKIMEVSSGKDPVSPYRGHRARVGKWYEITNSLPLSMCSNGFHTLSSKKEAIELCDLMHQRYQCGDNDTKTVVFECLVSVPKESAKWAPFSHEEYGPWGEDEFVTTKQISRYQKLGNLIHTAKENESK